MVHESDTLLLKKPGIEAPCSKLQGISSAKNGGFCDSLANPAASSGECARLTDQVNPAQGSQSEADSVNEMGARMIALGKPGEAGRYFQQAIALDPGFAEAYFNLGIACRAQNDWPKAVQCLKHALRLKPGFFQALFVIGNIFMDAAEFEDASVCFRGALSLAPEFAEAHFNLGNAAKAMGDFEQAAGCYARALKVRPDFAEALNNLGLIQKNMGRLDEALQCYERALALRPGMAEAHYNMGIALQLEGEYYRGLEQFQEALEHDRSYAPARWLYSLSLPIIYRSVDELAACRVRFEQHLERLVRETGLSTGADIQKAQSGIDSTTNFFLAYQGQDDLKLQKTYGDFVHRVMSSRYPQWSQPRPIPKRNGKARIRVGYLSSFMHSHTVGQYLLGWLQAQHRDRFQLFCYHIGHATDPLTERLREHSDVFRHIGGHLQKAAARILADDLHILVFFDIGMETLTTQLAGLRLAPVQCTTWGHPVTSGLPTIDYFLSSNLMEPEGAETHYTETLVRLPNIALNYSPPRLPQQPKSREDLGLGQDAFVYFSSQSLFKYLPQHDDIYPRIARDVPNAQFVFIANCRTGLTRQFEDRLATVFRAHGLHFNEFCRIQPRLGSNDFLSLNLAADVLLDSMEWSGGRTTLEAISCNLPVVTLPGPFMRGRHTYAMLKMMGVADTIAADKEDYIRIAAELGRNPEWTAAVRSQVATGKERLYSDKTFIDALEAFYIQVANRGHPMKAASTAPQPQMSRKTSNTHRMAINATMIDP